MNFKRKEKSVEEMNEAELWGEMRKIGNDLRRRGSALKFLDNLPLVSRGVSLDLLLELGDSPLIQSKLCVDWEDVLLRKDIDLYINHLIQKTRSRLRFALSREYTEPSTPRNIDSYLSLFDGLCSGRSKASIASELSISQQRITQMLSKLRELKPIQDFYKHLKELQYA